MMPVIQAYRPILRYHRELIPLECVPKHLGKEKISKAYVFVGLGSIWEQVNDCLSPFASSQLAASSAIDRMGQLICTPNNQSINIYQVDGQVVTFVFASHDETNIRPHAGHPSRPTARLTTSDELTFKPTLFCSSRQSAKPPKGKFHYFFYHETNNRPRTT